MDPYRLAVLGHIVLAIVLTGLALFWAIMLVSLRRHHEPVEVERLLHTVNGARWPHVAVPWSLRLPLPWMSWATLLALALSGAAALAFREMPASRMWWAKMALCGAIVGVQALSTRAPSALMIRLNFALVVAAVLAAGWSIR